MTSIVVTFDDNGLPARFARAPQVIRAELVAMVDRLTARGVRVGRERVRKDTRRLERSLIQRRARAIGPRVVGGWGTDERHGPPNEFGRRAGARMPPSGVLLGWMGRRGIPPEREFVVRRAIGRRGIRPQPFVAPGVEEVRRMAPIEVALAASRIVARVDGGR